MRYPTIVLLTIFFVSLSFSASREVYFEKNGTVLKVFLDDSFSIDSDSSLSKRADSIFVGLKMFLHCHDFNVAVVNDSVNIPNYIGYIGVTSNHSYSPTYAPEPLAVIICYKLGDSARGSSDLHKINEEFKSEVGRLFPDKDRRVGSSSATY